MDYHNIWQPWVTFTQNTCLGFFNFNTSIQRQLFSNITDDILPTSHNVFPPKWNNTKYLKNKTVKPLSLQFLEASLQGPQMASEGRRGIIREVNVWDPLVQMCFISLSPALKEPTVHMTRRTSCFQLLLLPLKEKLPRSLWMWHRRQEGSRGIRIQRLTLAQPSGLRQRSS